MPVSYAILKSGKVLPLDDPEVVLPPPEADVVLLLPPPPHAAARNARATARVAAVTSHFHRILRFKTYLPVWSSLSRARAAPPPARRAILSEIEPSEASENA